MLTTPDIQLLLSPLFYFGDITYRVFWVYLLANGLIAAWLIHKKQHSIKNALAYLCSKQLWSHPSVLLDFKLIFLNHVIWLMLFAPFFASQIGLAVSTRRSLQNLLGKGEWFDWHITTVAAIYTFSVFIIDDFSRFIVHWAYHKYPLLWRFHAVHHSSTLLTPFTLYRVHIVEMLINALRSISVYGCVGGLFMYLFVGKIGPLEVFGASIFSILFNMAGANLRHSHIWLGYGKFEKYILSPAQHQIHHSANPKHYDKNFGVVLACWDRLSNNWVTSQDETVDAVGLAQPTQQTLKAHLFGIR